MRKVDLFAKDMVVVPVNVGNMHWTLCVAFMEMKHVQYYDSMSGQGARCVWRLRSSRLTVLPSFRALLLLPARA